MYTSVGNNMEGAIQSLMGQHDKNNRPRPSNTILHHTRSILGLQSSNPYILLHILLRLFSQPPSEVQGPAIMPSENVKCPAAPCWENPSIQICCERSVRICPQLNELLSPPCMGRSCPRPFTFGCFSPDTLLRLHLYASSDLSTWRAVQGQAFCHISKKKEFTGCKASKAQASRP